MKGENSAQIIAAAQNLKELMLKNNLQAIKAVKLLHVNARPNA